MSIGSRMKEWRDFKRISQKSAGEQLGITEGVYQKYESELRSPGSAPLAAFAKVGVNINWLLTGEGEMLLADVKNSPEPAQAKAETTGGVPTQERPERAPATDFKEVYGRFLQAEQLLKQVVADMGFMPPPATSQVLKALLLHDSGGTSYMAVRAVLSELQELSERQKAVEQPVKYLPTPAHEAIYRRISAATVRVIEWLEEMDCNMLAPTDMALAVELTYKHLEENEKNKDTNAEAFAKKAVKDLVESML